MELKTFIAAEAAEIDRSMQADIDGMKATLDPLLSEILEYGLFSGGKRLRPLLAILSARLCGSEDTGIYRLATAFEYLHVATLFHDDIIDRADSRRGRMSVNRRYGTVGAILAGDFLHTHSMDIVGRTGGSSALSVFSEATRGMVDGEFVQLRNSRNFDQSEDDYFSAIMGKTALLIGSTCEIGGIFGGADTTGRQALRSYGLSLGCAFQIVDDLLDYLGDQAQTGKMTGNDLIEGKMTLPLILAIQRAGDGEKNRLIKILEQEEERGSHFAEVVSLIEKNHGFTAARNKAEDIIATGLAALDAFDNQKDSAHFLMLHSLAQYVLDRQT